MQSFEAAVTRDENGKLTYIAIPFDAREAFGIPKGTVFVAGKMNDTEYRSKLLSRGNGNYILVLNKPFQKSLGLNENTRSVRVQMYPDNLAYSRLRPQPPLQAEAISGIQMAGIGMDIITAITGRRSIRRFKSASIDDNMMKTIINAGLSAPTAKDKRPCHFIIVREKASLLWLSQNHSNAGMLADAACGVIVCGDCNVEGTKEFLYADCAAATQNILLCAYGLGLGAVWCGVAANSEWKKLMTAEFHLPLKMEPVSVVALGYPDEIVKPQNRWDAGKIHMDKW